MASCYQGASESTSKLDLCYERMVVEWSSPAKLERGFLLWVEAGRRLFDFLRIGGRGLLVSCQKGRRTQIGGTNWVGGVDLPRRPCHVAPEVGPPIWKDVRTAVAPPSILSKTDGW